MTIEKIPPMLLPNVTEQDGRIYFRRDFWSCGPQLQQAELDDTNEFLSLLGLRLDHPQLEHDCLTGYIEKLEQ
jgi:hypothetical protein